MRGESTISPEMTGKLVSAYQALQGTVDAAAPAAVTGLPEDRTLAQEIRLAVGSPACVDLTGFTRDVADAARRPPRCCDGSPPRFRSASGDSDDERRRGMSPAEIIARNGQVGFRERRGYQIHG